MHRETINAITETVHAALGPDHPCYVNTLYALLAHRADPIDWRLMNVEPVRIRLDLPGERVDVEITPGGPTIVTVHGRL